MNPIAQPLRLNGAALLADPSGALFWPAQSLLAVADLHLEKAAALARRNGHLLPPYDTRATLARLAQVVTHYRPAKLVCLGDSFHDRDGAAGLGREDRKTLGLLAEEAELTWIEGNHDLGGLPAGLGKVMPELRLGPLVLRHEAAAGDKIAGEVSGHYHPKARVRLSARSVTTRCFMIDARRLILPAFGAYTGGLDVRDPAYAPLFPDGFDIVVLGEARALRLPGTALA